MKYAFLLISLSLAAPAKMLEGDLLDALESGGWGDDYRTNSSGPSSGDTSSDSAADPQISGNRTSQELNCNEEKERNTIPYRFLLGLLANKSLDISHDPHSGSLNFNGGIMIGNCQSMLETIVSKPNDDIPYYTFQVAVKRPGGCEGEKCGYEVTSIQNGNNSSSVKSFKPSFAGFVDCLKTTGVFKDGKIQQSKVAPVEFNHVERDINLTSEVVYANRGYKGTRYSGKFSENRLPDYPGCYYFEDLKSGGFKTYSVDDMENFELERLYQKVCNSGNYKLINSHIADFDQLEPFQDSLSKIRNELILDEVKRLHEIVSEAEDLSEADKAKFKEVTSDFLDHVIKPLKNDLAQLQRLYANPGHSQKENILNSVFGPERARELLGKSPTELKAAVKAEMDKRASELVGYARSPYLTKGDYEKMATGQSGAPIEDSTWSSAVLDLYEVHNTAFNYGRYSDDFWESHYQDNPRLKHEKRYASGAELNRKIESRLREKRGSLRRVSEVASNPGVDYGAKYERAKNAVVSDIDRQIERLRRNMQEAVIKVRTGCAREKAQKYWINQQACVRDAQAQLEACQRQIDALTQSREEAIRKYDGMIAEWRGAQSQARGDSSSSDSSQGDQPRNNGPGESGTFTFTPTETAQPTMNGQYSQIMKQMQWQMMMREQMRTRRQGSSGFNSGFNSGLRMNGNLGLNMGLNAGIGSQYSYRSPFMGYNSYYGNRGPATSYQQSMNPAVSYFGNRQTGPGGSFNFGAGAGNGMVYAGGTPGFYAPGGPGRGGAIGGGAGYTFGF